MVDLMADDKDNEAGVSTIENLQKRYKNLQHSLKRLEWMIDNRMKGGLDCSELVSDHDRKWEESENLREDIDSLIEKQETKRQCKNPIFERAKKVVKLVDSQLSDPKATQTPMISVPKVAPQVGGSTVVGNTPAQTCHPGIPEVASKVVDLTAVQTPLLNAPKNVATIGTTSKSVPTDITPRRIAGSGEVLE